MHTCTHTHTHTHTPQHIHTPVILGDTLLVSDGSGDNPTRIFGIGPDQIDPETRQPAFVGNGAGGMLMSMTTSDGTVDGRLARAV